MKGKFRTITCIATFNSFFIAFAVGFNSRHLLVVDPTLPPVTVEAPKPAPTATTTGSKPAGPPEEKKDKKSAGGKTPEKGKSAGTGKGSARGKGGAKAKSAGSKSSSSKGGARQAKKKNSK